MILIVFHSIHLNYCDLSVHGGQEVVLCWLLGLDRLIKKIYQVIVLINLECVRAIMTVMMILIVMFFMIAKCVNSVLEGIVMPQCL